MNGEPAPDAAVVAAPAVDAAPPATYRGQGLADCSTCGRRLIGMPNWQCADGGRGGPVCKQHADGHCGWVVVDCPKAKPGTPPPPRQQFAQEPPPASVADAAPPPPDAPDEPAPPTPAPCGKLPSERVLKTWPIKLVISPAACGPAHPPMPKVIKTLKDGTFIGEDRRFGCIRAKYGPCKHTKCLPAKTAIATPDGDVAISELRVGMAVWTRDAAGNRVAGTVLRSSSTEVGDDHRVVSLTLADGRSVEASVGHPIASGDDVERLRAGMTVDGAEVVRVETHRFAEPRTFDILPSGDTGVYWANGIPLRSTLGP